MAKRGKNEGSEFNPKNKKKRIRQISNREKIPYKEPVTQEQAIKTFKLENTNYLLMSITPYTFISFIILSLFKKKIFLLAP